MSAGVRRRTLLAASAVAIWLVLGFLIGPWTVREAYLGQSLPLFNAALEGRAEHPLGFYLDAWYGLVLRASATGVTIAGLAWSAMRFADRRVRLLDAVLGGEPALRPRTFTTLGVAAAALGGLAEASYLAVRQAVTQRPAAGFYPEIFWTAPASTVLAALPLLAVIVGASMLGSRRIGVSKATFVLVLIPTFGVLQSEGTTLHPVAALLLAAGLASVTARAAPNRLPKLERLEALAPACLTMLLIACTAWGVLLSPGLVERRLAAGRDVAPPGTPSIVLIILDTVRAASLSLYGYSRDTTPNLRELADSSVVFEKAVATAPWTLPSHATMFTGRYGSNLEVGSWSPLTDSVTTLAEALRAQGLATGGFVANHFYTTRMSGLQQGFERYEEIQVDVSRVLSASWLSRSVLAPLYARFDPLPPEYKSAGEVTKEFLDWQRTQGEAPFFAFLNYFDAHSPYYQPPGHDHFGPRPSERWFDFEYRWREGEWTPEGGRAWQNMYDAAIHYMDAELGVVVDSLRARGALDHTVIVVTSDHGEMWGERGLFGHDNTVYDPVLRVPLLAFVPGSPMAGSRIPDGVTLRDLPATLARIAGLTDGSFPGVAWTFDGAALPEATSPLQSHVSPDPRNHYEGPYERGEMRSLYEGDTHYIVEDNGVEELYDLSLDPLESTNVIGQPTYEETVRRFRSLSDSIWTP